MIGLFFLLQAIIFWTGLIKVTNEQKTFIPKEKEINIQYKQRLIIHENEMQEIEKNPVQYTRERAMGIEGYRKIIKEKIIDRAVIPRIWQNNFPKENKNFKTQYSLVEKKKSGRSFPLKDKPERFFTKKFDININNLPLKGDAKKHPWSGTYWPMRNGITSVRYNNNEKNTIGQVNPQTGDFLTQYDFLTSVNMYQQPEDYRNQMAMNKSKIEHYVDDVFSPSEKYDLLVGDLQFTLTNQQKNEGKKHYQEYGGDIPTWFGICHGWAPAAYHFDEPKIPVNVTSLSGIKIKFLPDDIKALASLYIANAYTHTNFAGDICRVYKPATPNADSESKLYLDPRCHTINPGTMAIILGNHIGKEGKNMIFDPDADAEVWNQPVNSYVMRFFNLITNEFSGDPQDVKIPLKYIRKSRDTFLNFLSRQADRDTEYVVGIYVNVTYAAETNAYHNDKAWPNVNRTAESIGAIELDKDDNIVGGEWKYNKHPNFMWKFDEEFPIESCCDKNYAKFEGKPTDDLTNWAAMASSKGQVIKSVVDYLVRESSKNVTVTSEQQIRNRWDFLFTTNN